VSLTGSDLACLEAHGGAAAWVAAHAQGWLDFWAAAIGRRGFYPFDLLAGTYVRAPHLFDCAEVAAWMGEDDTLWRWFSHAQALLVGTVQERPAEAHTSHTVVYCPQINAAVHQQLASWLTAPGQDRTWRGTR
jgi:hypothetical protein